MTFLGELIMIKRAILTIIALIMIVTGSAMLVYGQKIDVDIKTDNDRINIVEKYSIDFTESDTIAFWIQSGHSDVVIAINDLAINYTVNDNIYYVNISKIDITSENIFQVTYNLERDTDEFEKIIQYETDSFTIIFDENELYSGKNLDAGSSLNLALQHQVLGKTVEDIPTWIYIIIIVLVVLLIILFFVSVRKQKSITKKEEIGGSKELFVTKKSLLMETLKEIEKRHRSKQISDETYHKLKDEFKQDAVEAMRQLEDSKR
jgi:hypothetical protein